MVNLDGFVVAYLLQGWLLLVGHCCPRVCCDLTSKQIESRSFSFIAGHQFAFLEAPKGMKGFVMGLFICSWGLGSYLGTLLTWIVNWASGKYRDFLSSLGLEDDK
jgi:hypothetical protein